MSRLLFILIANSLFSNFLHADNFNNNETARQKNDIYMKKIEELLKVEKLEKCAYGPNPQISDLCTDYKSKQVEFVKFNDIIDALTNLECGIDNASSCFIDASNIHSFTISFFNKYGESFCHVTPCFFGIKSYADKCMTGKSMKSIYNSIPHLCAIYREKDFNNSCLHEALSIIFSTVLTIKNQKSNVILISYISSFANSIIKN
jgi:hypothetical protein